MSVSLRMLGAIVAVSAAPASALAQPTVQAISNGMASQVTAQAPHRAQPVSVAARQAVARAPFEKPGPRVLDLSIRGDDKLRERVEVREKDGWNDAEGLRLTATRVAYTRRF